MSRWTRRNILRGMARGSAVIVGLPLLDMFLDGNGEALANGAPIPIRFGTWFWGCGVNTARWFPTRQGKGYDLKPELARPDLWRRFAAGERGRPIAALGGIRDRSSLALTAARMREDTVFRDAAHHFLRTFDKTFAAFEANATDAELADLADTRTARAFMLFGRVTGVFD